MSTKQRWPGLGIGPAQTSRAATTSIVSHAADNPYGPTLKLATLARDKFEVFTDGYSSGYAAGLAAGRADTEAEMAAAWSALAAKIRRIPDWPTRDELAERRAS